MRKDATRQKKHLWYDFLSSYPVRFQRQKTIGSYIVDFYCHLAKLVIELDGSQHCTESGAKQDAIRTAELEMQGIHVLRFSNYDIDTGFENVCASIDQVIQARLRDEK
ncbi:MAG: DUF559 domain-containing protein [Ruminococcaceae bacterium]|nr:DUF559 domain-containing protein [Oscillospiraceae bacterium]